MTKKAFKVILILERVIEMQFIECVKKEDFDCFVCNHPYKSHFMQSYAWGEVMKKKNFLPHYVGLKENDKLIATALLLEKKLIGNYSYFYCPRGFVWNYNDEQILKEITKELKKYAKKKNAIFIKIDPDIKRHDLDINGNIINPESNHYTLIKNLESLGYKNKGFNTFFVNEQPRFTFRLDLKKDWDSIIKNMHPTTRKIYNKKNPFHLKLYIGQEKDLIDFYETMKETAKMENIRCNSIEYYKHFYKTLHRENMSDLYVVKVNIHELQEFYQKKVDQLKIQINSIDKSKYKNKQKLENKIKELENEKNKAIKELEKIKQIEQNELTLSSIITVKYGNKVWTIHGGNHSLLRELNANYLLYFQIMEDAHKQGYELIDFFGTSGIANPDKNDPIYGIHLFKKRLGGEYTEFIGEYDLIIHPFLYFGYQKLIPVYRKFRKKL